MAKKKAKPAKKVAKKKAVEKKAPKKRVTSLAKGKSKKPVAKRSTSAKGKKTPVKNKATAKEKDQKQANAIVNSEKKVVKKRVKVTSTKETNGLLDSIVFGMQERKAKNITVLDLRELENRISDFFVICDADSGTHVDAIADSVEEVVMKKTGEKPYHSEGRQNKEWILVDYIDIVVHVFLRESREYYNIEGLWGDAKIRTIN